MSAVAVLFLAALAQIAVSMTGSSKKATGLPVWVLVMSGVVLAVDAL